jgi:hypothetical protein
VAAFQEGDLEHAVALLALGDETFAAAWAAGASLTPDQGIGEILAAQS